MPGHNIDFDNSGYSKMGKRDFTATIKIKKSRGDVFRAITNDVAKWWGGKDFHGSSTKLNDEFAIHHPGAHFSKQKLVEVNPRSRVVWLITESKLDWLKVNKEEWTNTKIIFEIKTDGDTTQLRFTHEGLVPEKECYETCTVNGWELVIREWLFHFLEEGIAHFG